MRYAIISLLAYQLGTIKYILIVMRPESSKVNKYINQNYSYIQVVPTFRCSTIFLASLAFVFLLFGGITLYYELKNADILIPYDCGEQPSCTVDFTPTRSINPPIKIYYHISNFYTSYKSYVRSKSYLQF